MTAPRAVVVATARPTFAVETARRLAAAARDLLTGLGAEVTGPTDLVMSTEDVAAARPCLSADVDLVVNVCASFSDATPGPFQEGRISLGDPSRCADRARGDSQCG